jgi:hypothetical protein
MFYNKKYMKKIEMNQECCENKVFSGAQDCGRHFGGHGGCSNAIYSLGVAGALFYFLQGAGTFIAVITGIGKAFFWPAILMFKLLTYLQM